MYNFGDIVLIPFPFSDLSQSKLRPAVIVSKNNLSYNDVIVSFITTQSSFTKNTITIDEKESLFQSSGLKKSSKIRCDKIATLSKKIILGKIGFLPEQFYTIFGW
jgi:mRNA interferase MazF